MGISQDRLSQNPYIISICDDSKNLKIEKKFQFDIIKQLLARILLLNRTDGSDFKQRRVSCAVYGYDITTAPNRYPRNGLPDRDILSEPGISKNSVQKNQETIRKHDRSGNGCTGNSGENMIPGHNPGRAPRVTSYSFLKVFNEIAGSANVLRCMGGGYKPGLKLGRC